MGKSKKSGADRRPTACHVRAKIQAGGERVWRHTDFPGLSADAVAQALSRLARAGELQRLSKGIYYRGRQTALGPSRPNPVALRRLAADRKPVFPAGLAAANLLGFSTQTGKRGEVATSAGSLPRKLIGHETVIHTRRPAAWAGLSEEDAAMLDFLRRAGRTSELSAEETVQRTLQLCRQRGRFERLLAIADSEPPRTRAILGAIGDEIGARPKALEHLRDSLNPTSRFDFGLLAGLARAHAWQAKKAPARR